MCDIEDLHAAACAAGQLSYRDPGTGFRVFTSLSHKKRGACCGNGCRHCPFQHANVPPEKRAQLRLSTTGGLLYETADNAAGVESKAVAESQNAAPWVRFKAGDGDEEAHESGRGLKVYTRTGDSGTSQLFTGERRAKDDAAFEAMGTVDELSAFVGAAREECLQQGCSGLAAQLEAVLATLLDVGSAIATPLSGGRGAAWKAKRTRTAFDSDGAAAVRTLEAWIDALSEDLPPLGSFILASGGRAATSLHVCRTVCRRAERCTARLARGNGRLDGPVLDAQVCIYLNRASDFFFTAARAAAQDAAAEEVQYKRPDAAPGRRGLTRRTPNEPKSAPAAPAKTSGQANGAAAEGSPRPLLLCAPVLAVGIVLGMLTIRVAWKVEKPIR